MVKHRTRTKKPPPKPHIPQLKDQFICPFCIEDFNLYYITSPEQRASLRCYGHMRL